MELNNIVDIAVAYYKDKVQQELLEKFRAEARLLLLTESKARREKAGAIVAEMAKLRIELAKFKFTYEKLSSCCGKVEAVDQYIMDIEKRIKQLSFQKNNRQFH